MSVATRVVTREYQVARVATREGQLARVRMQLERVE